MNRVSKFSLRHCLPLALGLMGAGLITPQLAAAQQKDAAGEIAAPSVEVTAYRVPTLLQETSQGISIVTSKEIADRNPASVLDLIQELPGVYVDQVGSPGGVSNIHIRGSDPEQVLVVIDGVRVNDPMLSRGGSYDLSSLDTADIERIEVLRGGGSALYGADAMGGVINIVTKKGRAEAFAGSAGLEAGGQDYGKVKGSVSGGSDTVRYSANASKLRDGRDADGGSLDLGTFSGSLSFRPSENAGIALFARYIDRDSSNFPDESGGIRYAVDRTLEQHKAKETTYGADFSATAWNQTVFKLQLARYVREEDIDSPGVVPGPGGPFGLPATVSHTDFTRDSGLLSASFKLPRNSGLTVGYEHLREVGENRSVQDLPFFGPTPGDFNLTRDTDSTFAELKTEPVTDLILKFDIRYDSVSGLGSETSPGAGVRYTFADSQTALKARYTEGFRPPSFFALGDPTVGNPNLVSETSKGYEVGLEQPLMGDKARIGLTWFKTEYKNLIDFDTTIFKLVNRNTVDAEGAELELSLRTFEKLLLGLNYTYVDTRIVDSSAVLRNRPRHRAAFTARYPAGEAWLLSWSTVYVGEFFDSSVPTGDVKMGSYTRTDVSAAYKWNRYTASFAIDNLFNEKYEQYVGFVNPGVRVRAGLSAGF